MGDGETARRWREAVRAFVEPQLAERCELCRSRFERNVLRVLDCKNERCRELSERAPRLIDQLSDANRGHFDEVRRHLEAIGRGATVDPGIVRGLDYYTHTIFELHYPPSARAARCAAEVATTTSCATSAGLTCPRSDSPSASRPP